MHPSVKARDESSDRSVQLPVLLSAQLKEHLNAQHCCCLQGNLTVMWHCDDPDALSLSFSLSSGLANLCLLFYSVVTHNFISSVALFFAKNTHIPQTFVSKHPTYGYSPIANILLSWSREIYSTITIQNVAHTETLLSNFTLYNLGMCKPKAL